MDAGTVEQVIQQLGVTVAGMVGVLAEPGQAIAFSLSVLSVIALGLAFWNGASIAVGALMRTTAAITLTHWVIGQWETIVLGTLRGSRQIIGMLIPGYGGPSTLLDMAIATAGRIEVEQVAFSGVGQFIAGQIIGIIAPAFVFLGLAAIGILAILAEVLLLLGASVAPLLLPFLAFSSTADMGWGPLRFLLQSSIRVIMLGGANHILAVTITAVSAVPAGGESLPHETLYALMGLSLLCFLVAWSVNGIARDVAGGGVHSMGMGAVSQTAGYMVAMGAGAGASMSTGGGAAVKGAAAGARAAGSAMGRMGRVGDRAFN